MSLAVTLGLAMAKRPEPTPPKGRLLTATVRVEQYRKRPALVLRYVLPGATQILKGGGDLDHDAGELVASARDVDAVGDQIIPPDPDETPTTWQGWLALAVVWAAAELARRKLAERRMAIAAADREIDRWRTAEAVAFLAARDAARWTYPAPARPEAPPVNPVDCRTHPQFDGAAAAVRFAVSTALDRSPDWYPWRDPANVGEAVWSVVDGWAVVDGRAFGESLWRAEWADEWQAAKRWVSPEVCAWLIEHAATGRGGGRGGKLSRGALEALLASREAFDTELAVAHGDAAALRAAARLEATTLRAELARMVDKIVAKRFNFDSKTEREKQERRDDFIASLRRAAKGDELPREALEVLELDEAVAKATKQEERDNFDAARLRSLRLQVFPARLRAQLQKKQPAAKKSKRRTL